MVDVAVTSDVETVTPEQLSAVVDGLTSTYLSASVPAHQPLTLTFAFNGNRREWINRYSIQAATNRAAADPRDWRLSGSVDGMNWILLDYRSNEVFTTRGQRREFALTGNRNTFTHLKLEILARLDDDETTVQIGDVTVFAVMETSTEPISLKYNVEQVYYVGVTEYLELAPVYSGYHTFSISPALPDGLALHNSSGIIQGTVSASVVNTTAYTVTATSSRTSQVETFPFTLRIELCDPNSKTLVEILKYNMPGSDSDQVAILFAGTQQYSFAGRDGVTTDTHRFCLDRGNFELQLLKENGYGWALGSAIEIFLYDSLDNRVFIGRKTLRDLPKESMPLSTTMVMPKEDQPWYVFTGAAEPTADWISSPGSASADWQSYQLVNGKGPAVDRPVWFIKRQVYIQDLPQNTQSYELSVYCRSGVAVYVKGAEIYRANVPDGPITTTSTITGGSASPYWHRITGKIADFNAGLNNIAIAVVNTPANRNITIDLNVRLYFSQSSHMMPRTNGLIASATSTRTGYPITNLIDGDYQTRVVTQRPTDVNATVYWGVSFDEDSAELINKYCLITNDEAARYDPVRWTLYASNVGGEDMAQWTEVHNVENTRWMVRNQPGCYYMPAVDKAYRHYRIVLRENSGQVPDNMYSLAELALYSVNPNTLSDASLMYIPNARTGYYGMPITSLQPSEAGFSQCTVTPDLPTGLTIDTTGVISGTPLAAMQMTTYTVTCMNPRGTSRQNTVTLTINQCAAPNQPFTVVMPSVGEMGANMNVELTPTVSENTHHSYLTNYNTHYLTVCAQPGQLFKLRLTANKGYGYGDRYVSVRLADNREILRISSSGTTTVESPEFQPFYSVDDHSTWRYRYGEAPELSDWYRNNGTDTWATAEATELPATESITQYYTTTFNVPDPSKFVAVETQFRQQAGVIIRLNGQMLMYSNIPVGAVTNATLASAQYAVAQTRVNSNQNVNILQGTNVLAVEVHRGQNIPSMNLFRLKFLLLTDQMSRMVGGSGETNVEMVEEEHTAMAAMDENPNTYFKHDGVCEGTDLIWSYNNAAQHYVNSYSLTVGDACLNLLPSAWMVYGSRDGETWTLLDVQTNQQWSAQLSTLTYKFYNENNYAMFKLAITRCMTASVPTTCPVLGVRVNSLSFAVAKVDYNTVCASADGFPTAMTGTYAYTDCDMDHSGYRRRYCLNGFWQGAENYCTVSAPSSFSYPQDAYELVANVTVTPAITPIVVCADCTFSVTPDLPVGLTLDTLTGVISGMPTENVANQRYTITAFNMAGSINKVIDLLTTTEEVHCYVDLLNGWESTVANSTAVKACPNLVDYEGNMTRFCNPGSPAFWGPVIDNCTLLIPNITLVNTTFSFIKNQNIAPIVPIITGSQIYLRTISPTLPAGLYFDPNTARITGKPTQKISTTVYTITVYNNNGQAEATLSITVTALTCPSADGWLETDSGDLAYKNCPTNQEGNWYRQCSATNPPSWQQEVNQCLYIKPVVNYPSSSYALQLSTPVSLVPQTQYYITSWTMTGTLPAGLNFNTGNGQITGTPNTVTPLTTVTITASNPHKNTQVTLSLSVNVYSCNAEGIWPTTSAGQTVTRDCENVSLMEGSRTRMCISGTSSVYWGEITDTCRYKAPILTYANTQILLRKGEMMQTITPTTGNQIDTITINPTLPQGLTFHPTSGAISGTPTGNASNMAYTVTASNVDGKTEVVLQITVSVAACPASGEWQQTERGESAYTWCNGAQGVQERVCGNIEDVTPEWKDVDTSGCVKDPEDQKPGEGRSFVRFTMTLSGVTTTGWTPYAYAAVRRVMANALNVAEEDVMIEAASEGMVLKMRVATGLELGEDMKASIIQLVATTLTTQLRNSGVAGLGMASPSVDEGSFTITKYSLFNSAASTLVILIVILGVLLILAVVFSFMRRGKGGNSKKRGHDRMRENNRGGTRSKHRSYDDEEDELPRKKKSKKHYEEEEEEEAPRKKKSKKHYEEEEEEAPRKKKSKSKRYADSD